MTTQSVEMASVLFVDIVKYSVKSMEAQAAAITQLQEIVRGTPQFRTGSAAGDVLPLPTGDGMAIVFFRDPVAPVQCAMEIAGALTQIPTIRLRMGIHNGPICRHADIKDELNVLGGGINMAQRVMNCGDAGHILVSQTVADTLSQLGGWQEYLHDLGPCQVKHGVTVHLYNVYKGEVGNAIRPSGTHSRMMSGARWHINRMVRYLVPSLVMTFLVRLFFNTSPVTRDKPLAVSETILIFAACLVVVAVLQWVRHTIRRQSAS